MTKLKIGFDPTNCWDMKNFRDFIYDIVLDYETIELYLITTNTDNKFIGDVINDLKAVGKDKDGNYYFNENNVYTEVDNIAVISKISSLNVLIYLLVDYPECLEINKTIPIDLDQLTGCVAIGVVNLIDKYKLQMLYMTTFQFWLNQIGKRLNTNSKNC